MDASYFGYDAVLVRVRRGESANRVARSAVALSRHFPGLSKIAGFISETDQAGKIERAIRPQAIALAMFALLAALGALVIMGQIVSRQLFVSASDFPDLRALGVSRRQLLAITRAEIAAVAIVGMALAATFAVIASPLVLFGPARVIEPHPGIAPDWALLAVGAATIVVILMCLAEWPARRIANRALSSATIPTVEGRSTRVAHAAASLPTGPSATVGVRLALDPGAGRSAVPVRSTIAGIVIAVVSVTAAVTFGSNLVRLVHTPRLYGQTWTVAVDAQFGAVPTSAFVDLVGKQLGVDAWTFGDYVNLTTGGRDLPAIDLIRGRGAPLAPTILAGRAPAAADEIALGTKTLDQLGSRVGGSVVIPVGSRHVRFEVVGRAVLPAFSQGSFTPTGLGQGAVVWEPGIARLVPPGNGTAGPGAANFVLVHVARGAQQSANVAHFINAMQTNRTCPIGLCQFVRVQRPTDIVNYSRLETTPRILAALLAAFALASLAHLLMTSVRRRRRDIAVLRTLGFVRRQVFAIVGWQATTIVAVALAVGLPVGVLGGHWLWTEFATRVGVDAKGVIPILAILAAVAVTLVIANLLAAVPGWLAGRLRLATALRDEMGERAVIRVCVRVTNLSLVPDSDLSEQDAIILRTFAHLFRPPRSAY